MISVIIPTWNSARTLRVCLDSIASQTYTDVEIIVVDDASTDDTNIVLSNVSCQRLNVKCQLSTVTCIRHDVNKGPNAARNTGLRASKGEFVMFCDADVVLHSNALEKLLGALSAHPDASYAYSSFKFGWKTFIVGPFNAEKLRKMPMMHTTSLIRREHFPGFDETIKRFQDWDVYLTMLEQEHSGVWVAEELFTITSTKGTMSRWLPSFVYKIPWLSAVRRYREAERIIRKKHHGRIRSFDSTENP